MMYPFSVSTEIEFDKYCKECKERKTEPMDIWTWWNKLTEYDGYCEDCEEEAVEPKDFLTWLE